MVATAIAIIEYTVIAVAVTGGIGAAAVGAFVLYAIMEWMREGSH
jgi:hypothetical protein